MIRIKKINKEKITPVKLPKLKPENIKGYDLFPNVYSNLFILGRKHSGKSTVIFKILKKCADKDTKLYIFSSTVYKDPTWIHIVKHFKTKGNPIEIYTSMKDDGENHLKNIIETLNIEAELEQAEIEKEEEEKNNPEEEKINYIKVDPYNEDSESDSDKKKKKRKKKLIAPEIIFVFDDQGTLLRSTDVANLLKLHRHYKSKSIISSQYIHDIHPSSMRQLDYLLAFANITDEKIDKVHEGLDLPINADLFKKLYYHATSKKYNFLYIDINNTKFRINFNQEYQV